MTKKPVQEPMATVFTGSGRPIPSSACLTQAERDAETKDRLERIYGVSHVDDFDVERKQHEDDRGIVLFASSNPSSEVAAAFRRIAASLQSRVAEGHTLWSCDTLPRSASGSTRRAG